jgi:hypothetical protein
MVLNLGYNPSNMPNGIHAPHAFMSPQPNLLNVEQVPNLTEQENNNRFHKKRKSPPLKNHFSTNIDYTNKIMIGVGIISLVGFAYIISPFKNSRYSFSRSILYNII